MPSDATPDDRGPEIPGTVPPGSEIARYVEALDRLRRAGAVTDTEFDRVVAAVMAPSWPGLAPPAARLNFSPQRPKEET